MKKFQNIMLALLLISFAACQKKDVTSPVIDDTKITPAKKSKLELLCQTWTLDETYEDGTLKTTGGTGKYQYTRQGQFKFLSNGTWTDIGTFDFTTKDSTAISVLFGPTPTIMALKTLDEKSLKTEFTTGGKKLNYNYKR